MAQGGNAPIRFGDRQASGLEELAGQSPVAMNVLMDATGTVRRRPGIQTSDLAYASRITDAASFADHAIEGLYETLSGGLYVVGEAGGSRDLYYVTPTGSLNLSSSGALQQLMGSGVPQFAETEMLLVIAGGRELQKVELASNSSSRLGGTAPAATHIIGNASRLLANDSVVDRTKVRYSDIAQGTTTFAGHETWTVGVGTAGFFTAEAQPDPVVALGSSTNEILVFGSRTIQVYNSDPVLVFAPVMTVEAGCGAPYSVVKVDQKYFLLDDKKRFIQTDGRSYEVISAPIRRTIEEISQTSDCVGSRVLIGQYDCIVWSFPTDGRTFVYQIGAGWSQWSSLDVSRAAFGAFRASTFLLHSSGKNLIGTREGYVLELDLAAQTDAGQAFTAYVETGYLNRDTDSRKVSKSVRLALRRGETSDPSSPVAYFGWRDQPGPWDARLPIELGNSGDTEIVLQFYSLGVYRRRQWFFEFSGTTELVLVSATEDFEILES